LNAGKKILIADDEKDITDIIAYNLSKENYLVICAYDGAQALELFKKENPDLVLLDIMMPELDGFEVCRAIREKSQVPIIMLTARAEESDKVFGFDLGIDDYVTKPFSTNELIARVKANLRRTSNLKTDIIMFGDVKIYLESYKVFRGEELIYLTPKEFDLLLFLVSNPDKIFTRDELLKRVWNYEYFGDARTVDVTIRKLRTKIEKFPESPRYILTRRGVGYYFDSD